MNYNIKNNVNDIHDKVAAEQGVGSNVLWNGPFNTDSLPKGKGYSAGKNGIILNNDKPIYLAGPITSRAKARF